MYKLDHSFQSIRVSIENNQITKTTHFLDHFNSKLFMCSTWSIHSHILKFQTFLTSFDNFNAFNDLFLSKLTLKLKIKSNNLWKGWDLACYHHFTHIVCGENLRGLWKKLDAILVQTTLVECWSNLGKPRWPSQNLKKKFSPGWCLQPGQKIDL